MSEERLHDLEAAVISLHERAARLEELAARQYKALENVVELVNVLHRRLTAIRDAMGPQPPLTGQN